MSAQSDEQLVAAALHVYRRYQREFVEAHNLCPYAKMAREQGNVQEVVILQGPDGIEQPSLDWVGRLAAQRHVEIGLLIYPRVTWDRLTWERWVSGFVGRDADRHPPGKVPFAMAAFHPNARAVPEGDRRNAESLVPFIRRTPDPTIQLVRISALERVRRGHDEGTKFLDMTKVDLSTYVPEVKTSLRARISQANAKTLDRTGLEAVEALLDDIQAERARLYTALGEAPPAWQTETSEAASGEPLS